MGKRKAALWLSGLLTLSLLAGCGGSQAPAAATTASATSGAVNTGAATATTLAAQDTSSDTGSTTAAAAASSKGAVEVSHTTWDSADVTAIALNGDVITASGAGATVNGSTVTITRAGAYSLS